MRIEAIILIVGISLVMITAIAMMIAFKVYNSEKWFRILEGFGEFFAWGTIMVVIMVAIIHGGPVP